MKKKLSGNRAKAWGTAFSNSYFRHDMDTKKGYT